MTILNPRVCVLTLLGVFFLSTSASAADLSRVPQGTAGKDASGVKLKHLHLREGVRLLYGIASIRARYPYLLAKLPGEEKTVELTPGNVQRIFAPVTSKDAAKEFVRLLHAGLTIDSKVAYDAAVSAAKQQGYAVATKDAPARYGLEVQQQTDGDFNVYLLIYETSQHRLQVKSYTYFFGAKGFQKMTEQTYISGPYTSWQTGPLETPEAQEQDAKRWQDLLLFRKAVPEAIKKANRRTQ